MSAYWAVSVWRCDSSLSGAFFALITEQHHPISDLPAFFIHPCATADALQEVAVRKDVGPEEYLLLWLGLVGTGVNLHVPSKLLLEGERH